MLKLKVCGLTEPDNINKITALKPDMIGFVFYEASPRNYTGQFISSTAKRAGVFVDAAPSLVEEKIKEFKLDLIQLYHENIEPFQYLRSQVKIVKAISIKTSEDLDRTKLYKDQCDVFLFDTKGENAGGNGFKFDWRIIDHYQGELPFILSGGIGPQDVDIIKQIEHKKLYGIDINSKFETAPGIKNIELIKQFKNELYANIEHIK